MMDQVKSQEQKLDLWSGILHSHFLVDGSPVEVMTVCHPEHDVIAVKVVSSLIEEERFQVFTLFPAPDITHTNWSKAIQLNFNQDGRHTSEFSSETNNAVCLKRKMDSDSYEMRWDWNAGEFNQTANHEFTLIPDKNLKSFDFTVSFSKERPVHLKVNDVIENSERHWKSFWENGGFVSFEGSTDPRAHELERRVVLSQYLTAIHSGGSLPPQEKIGRAHV